MSLRVDTAWLISALLASVRVAAAIWFAPLLGPAKVPAAPKVVLAIALGSFLVSATVAPPSSGFASVGALAIAALAEAAIGLSFAFGFMAAYAATQIAGRALDVQVGFGAASILNPTTQTPAPLIGSLFGVLMIAGFLALDGHHVLLRALAASIQALPPSAGVVANFGAVLEQSAVMFTFALALAAPVMFLLWLSDVAMAVFARSMPQLNVFVLSFAIKVLLGMIGLAVSLTLTEAIFSRLFATTTRYWDGLGAG